MLGTKPQLCKNEKKGQVRAYDVTDDSAIRFIAPQNVCAHFTSQIHAGLHLNSCTRNEAITTKLLVYTLYRQ